MTSYHFTGRQKAHVKTLTMKRI